MPQYVLGGCPGMVPGMPHAWIGEAYPDADYAIPDGIGFSATARIPVRVDGPPEAIAALAADYRFPPIPGYPSTLEDYRQGMLKALDVWYAAQGDPGITISGITLAGDRASRSGYSELGGLYSGALLRGSMAEGDPAKVADKDGVWHEMTVGQLLDLLLAYGAAQLAISEQYGGYQVQILTAATSENLDAAVFS